MDSDQQDQKRWDPDRNETETERLDRNWASLLQELRVAQTGVTLLTGFLLTLPFADGFEELGSLMRAIYLATVTASIASTVLLIAPVGMHRLLFRQHRLDSLVSASHGFTLVGLALLGVAIAGVATLVFGVVLSDAAAWVAGGITLLALFAFWIVIPMRKRSAKSG